MNNRLRSYVLKKFTKEQDKRLKTAKKRYKNIKDTYLKIKRSRKMRPGMKMSRVSLKSTKWNLAPHLKCLDVLPDKVLTSHINVMDYDENSNSERNEDEEATDTQSGHYDQKLPPQLIQAKVKMLSIVMDLELQASSDV
ncbi:unnamed protein product [Macrosiphum euphorbiae]|uniref:Uncharacterized protein n=1 Tax=Macrosiphum euphorbiae TaxID=13131 RepID=A0AAV0WM60_9HEMI|nr:unnamed protein product [Macrosiphum euphorbiae]